MAAKGCLPPATREGLALQVPVLQASKEAVALYPEPSGPSLVPNTTLRCHSLWSRCAGHSFCRLPSDAGSPAVTESEPAPQEHRQRWGAGASV